jgi:hypothetical protein
MSEKQMELVKVAEQEAEKINSLEDLHSYLSSDEARKLVLPSPAVGYDENIGADAAKIEGLGVLLSAVGEKLGIDFYIASEEIGELGSPALVVNDTGVTYAVIQPDDRVVNKTEGVEGFFNMIKPLPGKPMASIEVVEM